MRRSPIVLTATAAGLAAVLGFDAHEPKLPSASASASPPAAGAAPAAGSGSHTATGDAIETRYGAAQVRVTVTGGRITAVQALQLQGNDSKSVQISSSAEPQL